MDTVILVVYVVVCIALIGMILIQQGKGADAGANFGGGSRGASGSVSGSPGASNFLSKTTALLATSFFCIALFLSYLSSVQINAAKEAVGGKLIEEKSLQQQEIPTIPGKISAVTPTGQITIDDKTLMPVENITTEAKVETKTASKEAKPAPVVEQKATSEVSTPVEEAKK